jgi:hypothetical protein
MDQKGSTIAHPWTTAEIKLLRANSSLGASALAAMLGRTPASVRRAAVRYRISLRASGERRGLVLGQPRGVSLKRDLRADLARDRRLAELVARNLSLPLDADLCPACARRPITVHSTGLCSVCHLRKLADAHRDAVAEIEARRELLAARQQLHRARDKENA